MSDDNGNNGQPYENLDAVPPAILADPDFQEQVAKIRTLETEILLQRMAWARQVGITHKGKRDTYEIFGYKDILTATDFRARYQRGGIAGRIVDVLPNACWRGSMEIIEDDTKEEYTEFEQAWADLDKKFQLQAKLQRVDKLAGLSTYAVLLIGAPGELESELPKGKPTQLLYFTPFSGGGGPGNTRSQTEASDADASIYEIDKNPKSARFGLPLLYQLKRIDIGNGVLPKVHWSRIIHIAENLLDDEVYGLPALERVWNLLDDLDKVTGGGAEAFWLRANQGLHLDIDKDMSLDDTKKTIEALKEQSEAYKHQLTRWLRTRGVSVQTLGSDTANFMSPADAILTQIAGSKGIPKRILTGSEMGELASSQDRDNWKDQVNGRQTQYVGPYIVRPLIDRLIKYGYLPTPGADPSAYEVKWPHIQTLTEQEKADGAMKWSQTKDGEDPIFTDAEIRDKWYMMPPLTEEQRKERADRKQEALKQQQEAMAAAQPPAPAAEDGKFPKAAAEHDDALLQQMWDAIQSGSCLLEIHQ